MVISRFLSIALTNVLVAVSASAQISSFPYNENFDAVVAPALPAGWLSSDARTPGVTDFATAATSARSLPNAVLSTNATIAQTLTSPLFDFSVAAPESLRFAVRRSASHLAGLIVEASLDGGTSFPLHVSDTLWNSGSTSYQLVSCALPHALATCPSVRFRWRIVPAASGSTGTVRLDDIAVSARAARDLAVTTVNILPTQPREGIPVSAAVTVVNCGTLPVTSSLVSCCWIVSGDTIPVTSQAISLMNPGDSLSLQLPLGNLSAGPRLLLISVAAEADGNSGNNLRTIAFSVALRPGSVVLNEIMYAPLMLQPEWVELCNMRDVTIELNGWSIADGSGTRHKVASSVALKPGGFALLTGDSPGLVSSFHPPGPVVQVPNFPSLNNSGDAVIVCDADGTAADSVFYDPVWGGATGYSLERVDPAEASTDFSNWGASVDSSGATPGARNSIARLPHDVKLSALSAHPSGSDVAVECEVVNVGSQVSEGLTVRLERLPLASTGEAATLIDSLRHSLPLLPRATVSLTLLWKKPIAGLSMIHAVAETALDERPTNNARGCTVAVPFVSQALAINEIMAAPLPGDAEYCELVNAGNSDVDITGWSLADRPTTEGNVNRWSIGDTGVVVRSGEFLVIASDSSIFRRFSALSRVPARLVKIANAGSLGLNNDNDDLILRDAAGTAIDSVSYASSWHTPALVDPAGHALERIAPPMASCNPRSWSSSVAPGGGTPGWQNSIYTRSLPSGSRLACAPNPFSPDGDGIDDFTLIHYELPAQESLLSISLYDITGHRIRHLVNAEPAGPTGDVPWDGRTDNAVRARIGIYIVLLEAVDQASGSTISAKTTLVLAGRL